MEITLPAICTLENMHEIQATLVNALQQGEAITVSFQQVERADLSFFQLLHVAEKSFQAAGLAVTWQQDLPARFAFKAAATNWSRLVPPVPAAPPVVPDPC